MVPDEIDIEALFRTQTVSQIRQYEKKIRNDIERKKEELRLMVGERYRDLIEAADTISLMNKCAEDVTVSLTKMQERCQTLRHFSFKPLRPRPANQGEDFQFFGTAAQVKLLMDMPEKLWSCLETGQFLLAARLFLLCRHVYTGLQLEGAARVLADMPLLARHWASLGHFHSAIIQASEQALQQSNLSEQQTCECLCAILLLQDSTPRQLFTQFLVARATAIHQLLESSHSSVKQLLCQVVTLLASTVQHIYTIFCHDNQGVTNLLMTTLNYVTTQADYSIVFNDPSTVAFKFLPSSVLDFRPSLRCSPSPVSDDVIKDSCQHWIRSCVDDVQSGVTKLLSFVKSAKALAAIRDEIWIVLTKTSSSEDWSSVTAVVLQRSFSLWHEFFDTLFLERVKQLLEEAGHEAVTSFNRQLERLLEELDETNADQGTEFNIAAYIWSEAVNDVTCLKTGSRSLTMKARAFTPAVQSLTRNLDDRLKVLLDDVASYVDPETNEELIDQTKAFDSFRHRDELYDFVGNLGRNCIRSIVSPMEEKVEDGRKQIKQDANVSLTSILLIGRLSSALSELSPHLKQSIVGNIPVAMEQKNRHQIAGRVSRVPDSPWTQQVALLNTLTLKAFSVWSEYRCCHLLEACKTNLMTVPLASCARWEEEKVEEEAEDGRTLASTIRVPMQASWPIQSLLFCACQEVNKVGGHALSRTALQAFLHDLVCGLVTIYSELVKTAMSQNQTLQLLFDLKFLTIILPRQEKLSDKVDPDVDIKRLISELESRVDPFDLDVFMPYIERHLVRQSHRTQVLFGTLSWFSPLTQSSRPSLTAGHQEQHNVLVLSSGTSRYQLLPLSAQKASTPVITAPQTRINPAPLSDQPVAPGFLGNVSTLWFSK